MNGTNGILQENKRNRLRVEINIFIKSFCHTRILKQNIIEFNLKN